MHMGWNNDPESCVCIGAWPPWKLPECADLPIRAWLTVRLVAPFDFKLNFNVSVSASS